jgi:hypothetical protein
LDIDVDERIGAPFEEFSCLFPVPAVEDDLEVEIPDVEVEDDEALVVGVILGVAGGTQVIKTHLPVQLLVHDRILVA